MMPDWSLPRQFPDLFNNAILLQAPKSVATCITARLNGGVEIAK